MTTKERQADFQAFLKEQKAGPCTDCKRSFPTEAMDFDHLRDKKFHIATAVGRNRGKIIAEIAKCELVCANCHRTRTKTRRHDEQLYGERLRQA